VGRIGSDVAGAILHIFNRVGLKAAVDVAVWGTRTVFRGSVFQEVFILVVCMWTDILGN